MTGWLKDKVALITGAASGLGSAAASLFVSEGAAVVVADVNDSLGQVICRNIGDKALFTRLDVTRAEDWRGALDVIAQRFGRLDILVNNAGIVRAGSPETTTIEDFHLQMGVMAEGTFHGLKHGIPLMKEKGGSIINMSSIANYKGFPQGLAYGAAKGAIRNMTKTVAVFCQKQGYPVRCNSVHPGLIRTPMTEGMFDQLGVAPSLIGEAEDVANLLLFLASDRSRFINGAEIVIDGGITLMPPGG